MIYIYLVNDLIMVGFLFFTSIFKILIEINPKTPKQLSNIENNSASR